ncbi:Z1 domain-containing protein [Candidatus Foliamicus sp.]
MSELDTLQIMVQALLAQESPSQDRIREIIAEARPACPNVTDAQAEQLAIKFEEIHGVRMTDGAALTDPEFEPWLDTARSEIDYYYWDRYRQLMTGKGLSGQVLGGLSNVTDRILGLLENPHKTGRWDRRGMVMGHVQSGKTANYIGVISKAADAGYRVIIIIAGLQNKLRDQTQRRVDEGFIGFSSLAAAGNKLTKRNKIGVGRYNAQRQPAAFTTSCRDFHKGIAESLNVPLQNLKEPAVFVIKKNVSTLRNLIDWLRTHNAKLGTDTISEPMLLIDDEADNASINIQTRMDEVSRINGQIRELLNLFERSCYVGYTATPFANIFIDPDTEDQMVAHDLFPRDFMVSLDAPTNYFGPSQVFREDGRVVKDLEDYADLLPTSHRIDHVIAALPDSLRDAMRAFILARAIRLARGHAHAHNSMLVNVSRFVAVQRQVRNEIQTLLESVRSSIRVNGSKPPHRALCDPELAELSRVFQEEYEDTCGLDWVKVQPLLHASASAVKVVEVNSQAPGSLDYAQNERTGLNVIAVGGLSLSRGLTLEGLTVSYFLRRSLMYDTLFQMGRWFGYRAGYDDLCRVWMPEEAQGWYEHIADSIEELRDTLTRMESANLTPRDFGLKVRSHPDTLVVTARNKMGTGRPHTVLIDLANQFVETAILLRDEESISNNLCAVEQMAEEMRSLDLAPSDGEPMSGGRLVRDVPVSVVDAFLCAFRNHPNSLKTHTEPIRRYIRLRAMSELSAWDVLFAGRQVPTSRLPVDERLGFGLVCQRRAPGKGSDELMLKVTSKHRVSSRGITRVGLTQEEASAAEQEYDSRRPREKEAANYPDWIYTRVRSKPLLVIHLLAIGKKEEDLSQSSPIAAWSISFPKTSVAKSQVKYVVNTTWYREQYGDDDDADDEFDESDDQRSLGGH